MFERATKTVRFPCTFEHILNPSGIATGLPLWSTCLLPTQRQLHQLRLLPTNVPSLGIPQYPITTARRGNRLLSPLDPQAKPPPRSYLPIGHPLHQTRLSHPMKPFPGQGRTMPVSKQKSPLRLDNSAPQRRTLHGTLCNTIWFAYDFDRYPQGCI